MALLPADSTLQVLILELECVGLCAGSHMEDALDARISWLVTAIGELTAELMPLSKNRLIWGGRSPVGIYP
jgi:hypothetical protein